MTLLVCGADVTTGIAPSTVSKAAKGSSDPAAGGLPATSAAAADGAAWGGLGVEATPENRSSNPKPVVCAGATGAACCGGEVVGVGLIVAAGAGAGGGAAAAGFDPGHGEGKQWH